MLTKSVAAYWNAFVETPLYSTRHHKNRWGHVVVPGPGHCRLLLVRDVNLSSVMDCLKKSVDKEPRMSDDHDRIGPDKKPSES